MVLILYECGTYDFHLVNNPVYFGFLYIVVEKELRI